MFLPEVRANAIAFFYAVGSGLGGIAGPVLFGAAVQTGDRSQLLIGYLIGAALILVGAVAKWCSVSTPSNACKMGDPAVSLLSQPASGEGGLHSEVVDRPIIVAPA